MLFCLSKKDTHGITNSFIMTSDTLLSPHFSAWTAKTVTGLSATPCHWLFLNNTSDLEHSNFLVPRKMYGNNKDASRSVWVNNFVRTVRYSLNLKLFVFAVQKDPPYFFLKYDLIHSSVSLTLVYNDVISPIIWITLKSSLYILFFITIAVRASNPTAFIFFKTRRAG
jgi:hypothetical protein